MQQQQMGVGMTGSKSYKTSSMPGTSGGTVTPAAKGGNPDGFGWKMLDYKFGDRPMYQAAKQMMKNKASGGGFCGSQPTGAGGMAAPAAAGGVPNTAPNPDPVTPEMGPEAGAEAAAAPETAEAFL